MNDQKYKKMLTDVTSESDFEKACEMLTQLHKEMERRTAEYYGSKRTQRSIRSRAFINAANTVRLKFKKFVTLSKRGRYEVTEFGQRVQNRRGWQ